MVPLLLALSLSFVIHPVRNPVYTCPRRPLHVVAQTMDPRGGGGKGGGNYGDGFGSSNYASDGADDDVDWDDEATQLDALAQPMNQYYKTVSDIELPELLKEFAQTAPKEVQVAVKATVAALLGNLPPAVGDSAIQTTGKSLASLMFNMQMTGYLFRNAQYRKSVAAALAGPSEAVTGALPAALPPVSGSISVRLGEGMEAQVDATAYMAELRSEVEGLRSQLARVKAAMAPKEQSTGMELISYIQQLKPEEQQELTRDVSPEILEAMSQLVATILIDLNLSREMEMAAPQAKVRELLVWQLISGYKLRELEVKEELKDKFWGADAEPEESKEEGA